MIVSSRSTPQWHAYAACRNLGEADRIFFPVRSVEERIGVGEAKTYCDACPVMYDCLKAAFDGAEYGIWGGLTHAERLTLRSKMRPSHFATVKALEAFLEQDLPKCSVCARHRKNKKGSGMCAECFYATRREAERNKPKAPCTAAECTEEVHAKGKCVKHYHAALRAAEKKATAAGKARGRKKSGKVAA